MGYFSNSTEGAFYEDKYCQHCVHYHPDYSCPCLEAHALWNYDECNKKNSILHKMIPRDKTGNQKCIFFVESGGLSDIMKSIRKQIGLDP